MAGWAWSPGLAHEVAARVRTSDGEHPVSRPSADVGLQVSLLLTHLSLETAPGETSNYRPHVPGGETGAGDIPAVRPAALGYPNGADESPKATQQRGQASRPGSVCRLLKTSMSISLNFA